MADQPPQGAYPQPQGAPQPPGDPVPPPPAASAPPPGAYAPQSGAYTPPPDAWQAPIEIGPAPGVRFAGAGARLVAYLIDGFIQVVVAFALFTVVGIIFAGAAATDSQAVAGVGILGFLLAALGYVIFALVYFPYFWVHGGQTPGMKLFRIRVVRDADGGPILWGPAILRLIGYWINQLVFYIGFAWILVDKRRRGWHDLIAGTCVVEA